MDSKPDWSLISEDERCKVYLKAARALMLKRKEREAKKLVDLQTGVLRSKDIARDYEDALEQYTKTVQNIGLLESVIMFS